MCARAHLTDVLLSEKWFADNKDKGPQGDKCTPKICSSSMCRYGMVRHLPYRAHIRCVRRRFRNQFAYVHVPNVRDSVFPIG